MSYGFVPIGNSLDYLAAIVDGEGTIDIDKSIYLTIGTTDKCLSDWLEDNYGGHSCIQIAKNEKWSDSYHWAISGRRAYKTICKISNRLIIKKEQADCAINYYNKIIKGRHFGGGCGMPLWLKEKRSSYIDVIKKLNKKGRNKEEYKLRNSEEIFIEDKLSYLAGLLDGEGTITLGKTNNTYQIQTHVDNTDPRVIEWTLNNFKGSTYDLHNPTSFRWNAGDRNAYMILKKVKDYLIIKKEQAEICITMYEKVTRHQYCAKKPKPVWAKDFQKTCYLKVRELNKSGVKKVGMEVNESWSIEKYCPSQKSILSY